MAEFKTEASWLMAYYHLTTDVPHGINSYLQFNITF